MKDKKGKQNGCKRSFKENERKLLFSSCNSPCRKDENYEVGDICRNSFDWNYEKDESTFEDDEPVELSGTCGMRIENLENLDNEEAAEAEKILEKALKDSESYDYGYQTVIIAGDRYEYGSDEDEIIVENAEVIGIV